MLQNTTLPHITKPVWEPDIVVGGDVTPSVTWDAKNMLKGARHVLKGVRERLFFLSLLDSCSFSCL